jgi:hypothetical protein
MLCDAGVDHSDRKARPSDQRDVGVEISLFTST